MGCGSWQIDAIDIMIPSVYHYPSTATRVTRLMSMLTESIKEIALAAEQGIAREVLKGHTLWSL